MSVKAVNAIPGPKPHKTFAVFEHTGHGLMRKALLSGIILHLAFWLCENIGLRQKKDHYEIKSKSNVRKKAYSLRKEPDGQISSIFNSSNHQVFFVAHNSKQ